MRHIVDTLIEERAASLMRNPALWRAVRTFIYPLLGYDRAVDMANTIRSGSTQSPGFDPVMARCQIFAIAA